MSTNLKKRLENLAGRVSWLEYEHKQLAIKQLKHAHAKVIRVANEVGVARMGLRKTRQVFHKIEEAEETYGLLNPKVSFRKYKDNMVYDMQLLISYFEDSRVRKAIVQELLPWVSQLPILVDVLFPFLDE